MVKETQKTPLQFYKSSSGNEPVRDWLKALGEQGAIFYWTRSDAGAMALAGGYAVMPSDGAWFIGNTHNPAKQPHCTRVGMFAQWHITGFARLHKEDTENARR
jgi:hypothetical protein